MNKRPRIAVILLLLFLLVGMISAATWQIHRGKQLAPTYLGKPYRFWVKHLNPTQQEGGLYSVEFVIDTNAVSYDWHMKWETDTNALPVFVGALEVHSTDLGKLYLKLWKKLPYGLRDHAPRPFDAEAVRAWAIRGITAMGEEFARPAIPVLIGVSKKDESPLVRQFAVDCLATLSKSRLDRDVMDAWIEASRDKDPMVSRFAVIWLKQMCPEVAIEAGIK
jgi:hypothetical protein